jgi:hypothetical protein
MAGRLEANASLLTGVGSGVTAIAAAWVGFIEPAEAAYFAAGGVLASTILATASNDAPDALHPARLQLARFRRSGTPADILVVKLAQIPSRTRRSASRRNARSAASVLRVTDGVAIVPSLRRYQLCAVIEADDGARNAIERRLRNVCGSDVSIGWASFPDDGVALEPLIAAASDRVPERLAPPPRSPMPQTLPARGLASRSLDPGRPPARRLR